MKTNKKPSTVQIVRAVVQLVSFIIAPGLFITIFSSIGEIWKAVLGGSFTLEEYGMRLVLLAAVFGITVIFGRFFCGFICSFGAMQDLLWLAGSRFPKKISIFEKADRILRYLKYTVLLFIVTAVWTLAIFGDSIWSPWTIFGMYFTFRSLPSPVFLLSLGGALMLVTIVGSLLTERFFCKYLCPLGAMFSLASHFRLLKIKKTTEKCASCKLCSKKCSMALPLDKYDSISSGECINCMKCTSNCPKENASVQAIPAVSGAAAAAALIGISYIGTAPLPQSTGVFSEANAAELVESSDSGQYKNGTYTGSADGYRGEIDVTVTVSDGKISQISVYSYHDDIEFFEKAESRIIPAIIEAQDTDVSAVSGATFSSRGIIAAVENALGSQLLQSSSLSEESSQQVQSRDSESSVQQESSERNNNRKIREIFSESESYVSESESNIQPESSEESSETHEDIYEQSSRTESSTYSEAESSQQSSEDETQSSTFANGTYTGSGTGFRGTTTVQVTVQGGMITDITVTSYADDNKYFSRAQSGIIQRILSAQSTDVDTVSGATFSSNGLIEAVSDALGIEFTNPILSMSGPRGRH